MRDSQKTKQAWLKSCLCLVALLLSAVTAWAASPPTVYVDWDGGGDYNTDGTNDEVQINQALSYVGANLGSGYTTVYLRGAHDYIIDNSVKIPSGVTLTGDSTAAIKLVNSADWAKNVPMVTATGTSGMHDITVHGFEIDGNDANNYTGGRLRGQEYYKALSFIGTTRLYVYNMYIHHNMDDGLKVNNCTYVYYHDNDILNHGHDGLQTYKGGYIYAYNNVITNRTNCGIRFAESNHCEAYGNDISTASGGNAGIQIQRSNSDSTMDDILVHDNRLHTSDGPGIWMFCNQTTTYAQTKARNVKIYNNVFYNCEGGIQTTGWYDTYIDNNVIDACGTAIYIYNPSYPPPSGGTGYDTHLNNNILCYNTYGIRQTYTNGSHTVDSDYDDYYTNTTNSSGSGITITHQLTVNPEFFNLDGHDYHLKSVAGRWDGDSWEHDLTSSPLIDAGDPGMPYTNEPEDNGDRINVGAYGNTDKASMSGTGGGGELGVSYDNRLKDNTPTTVYASNTYLDVGYNGTAKYRDIIYFDMTPYMDDSSASITDAKLSMYWYFPTTTRAADTVVQIMKPESGWAHDYVCWSNKASGTAWTYAGGDWTDSTGASQGTSAFASVTFPAGTTATNQYYDWNVTSLVQNIISGGVNSGMFIKASAETSANYIAFYGNANASNRPKLSITRIASQTEGTAASDNRLRQATPTTVYLTSTYNDVGYLNGTGAFRDIVWFDLAPFADVETITSAKLSLYWYHPPTTRTNDTIVDIYRPASGWNKDYVCWNNKASGVAWTNAGGDWYDANSTAQGSTPYATYTFPGGTVATNQYYTFDVTALVNYYRSSGTNAGFFIKARTESDNYIGFYSLNNATSKPKLEVTSTIQLP